MIINIYIYIYWTLSEYILIFFEHLMQAKYKGISRCHEFGFTFTICCPPLTASPTVFMIPTLNPPVISQALVERTAYRSNFLKLNSSGNAAE